MQISFDQKMTLLNFNAPGAYPGHMVWFRFTEKKRQDLTDYGYTLFGLLPVGTDELTVKDRTLE